MSVATVQKHRRCVMDTLDESKVIVGGKSLREIGVVADLRKPLMELLIDKRNTDTAHTTSLQVSPNHTTTGRTHHVQRGPQTARQLVA